MSYGAQNREDAKILDRLLSYFAGKPLRFLEVGIHTGTTARGIKEFCDRQGTTLEYWGIDAVPPNPVPPFPGAHFVAGDSAEVFHLVPDHFDVVFIDACHCRNHVILDTLNYGAKVVPGGAMAFHDTSPEIQQTMKDPHGPSIPQFFNSVLEAHALMGFPSAGWRLAFEGYEPGHEYGGIKVYHKFA